MTRKSILARIVIVMIVSMLALALLYLLNSCRTCPPASQITNGRAAQRHDSRKFYSYRATYHREGNFWVVRYENKLHLYTEVYECKPDFPSGSWVTK